MILKRFAAIVVSLVLTSGSLYADVIFLRNQRYIKGSVTGQSTDSIQVKLADGTVKSIKKKAIKKIIYVPAARQTELDEEAKRIREERARREREERRKRELEEQKRREAIRKKREEERRRREAARRARERKQRNEERLFGATWRNAVFPGWGHVYGGRDELGKQLMYASGFTLFFWYILDRDFRAADYDTAVNAGLIGAAGSPAIAITAALRAERARDDSNTIGERAYLFQILYLTLVWFGIYDIRTRGISGFSLRLSPSLDIAGPGRNGSAPGRDIFASYTRRF